MDMYEFAASLFYTVNSRSAGATWGDPVSKKKNNKRFHIQVCEFPTPVLLVLSLLLPQKTLAVYLHMMAASWIWSSFSL